MGCSGAQWDVVGCSGAQWDAVGCSGAQWDAVGRSVAQWDAVGCSGMQWGAVGCSGAQWDAVGRSGTQLGAVALPLESLALNLENPGSNPLAVVLKLWHFRSLHVASVVAVIAEWLNASQRSHPLASSSMMYCLLTDW